MYYAHFTAVQHTSQTTTVHLPFKPLAMLTIKATHVPLSILNVFCSCFFCTFHHMFHSCREISSQKK